MEVRNILLPNRPDTFLLTELRARLKEGMEVRVAFGGISMLPLISGGSDTIRLRPLRQEEEPVAGDVYLFVRQGHHIVHRLMRREAACHSGLSVLTEVPSACSTRVSRARMSCRRTRSQL